jgi:phytoene synthase
MPDATGAPDGLKAGSPLHDEFSPLMLAELRTSTSLAQSYAFCESLARREAGNFYHAFRVLPNAQRRAMCALYAFLRVADDLTDGPEDLADKRVALRAWRHNLDRALKGHYSHRLHPAFHHTLLTHRIPREYIEAVLDGVEMDLEPVHFATFAQLQVYCYRVASAVGLACIHIWGFADERAIPFATQAGIAFQLTNILRDLGEDAARGRVYLPQEDLERFGYGAEDLRQATCNDAFRALMRFEVTRAHAFYDAAMPLAEFLPPAGRAVFWVMARTYRGLLGVMERRDYDVFSSRVRLSTWSKLFLGVRALPLRWGWA